MNNKDHLFFILDALMDPIYITDSKGNTIWLNTAGEKEFGSKERLIGKNVKELEKSGFFKPSVNRQTLESGKSISLVQTINEDKKFLVTGHLVKDEKGEIIYSVAHGRDITNTFHKSFQLKETEALLKHYSHEVRKLIIDNDDNLQEVKLTGKSPMFTSLVEKLNVISSVDTTVLITGETGVGKSLIAKHIHHLSNRSDGPFIQINCSSIPHALIESELFGYTPGSFTGANKAGKSGLVAMAETGTLFLDEIGELPLDLQSKILHLIQEKSYMPIGDTKWRQANVRIIAATNRNLEEMIEANEFRTDLFYRLNVLPVNVPALRDRLEDIGYLINHFLMKFNSVHHRKKDISLEAITALESYQWPGNIRELENLIERLVILSPNREIEVKDLPDYIKTAEKMSFSLSLASNKDMPNMVKELETALIIEAHKQHKTTRKMASALGITQSSLVRRIYKYEIKL